MNASPRRLPVLMYHKVSDERADRLTIPAAELEKQLFWLSAKGYTSITFQDLHAFMETGKPLPPRPVIITFDDAFTSFETLAVPLLNQAGFVATLFVPVAYMGKTNIWDAGEEQILSASRIKALQQSGTAEIGIHSFLHRSYAEMAPDEMAEDLESCFQTLDYHKIGVSRVLAYPYGGFPKRDAERKEEMKRLFAGMDLWFALRIGNRVNRLPLKERYEINRIDIRGTDTIARFRIIVKFGRKHPFA